MTAESSGYGVVGHFADFFRNPKRKRGAITNPLAYASGYDLKDNFMVIPSSW
jgi:hypothetical protein